ncbi:hypothetical protein GUITHDRAFT_114037 [Guillardia theta CCMP2712]|uniref:Uncharacterized protein n=1 Tax=Guillardia theta (strain CCMP2712) TaxID=905079 RepID=L1IUN7_GUITC|nr:hypothetical protein GUITHDRAFT_114037 [Guillardia theta CCMP2712]EKX39787.1 hypothetical protein GUITHDRAFT_114037 [Guillardia theta CCMP2712]|eukprot:XP_005826767.1 hypothetical protein GUITHDRAFT_114037 [Guillardia theta CCMP2712]
MQLTLQALLSGARRMTPLRAQALHEPEDSSSSDFVESPEEGIGFTGRRHTVHSEKLHKHTQNTSPKRTSTAGTQTRQRQPKREAAQTSSLRVKQSSNKQQEESLPAREVSDFIWYLADIIAQRSMPLEDAAFGRHFVPDDGPDAEVLARKRAATYQRLTMQLTLEALLSGARRMTPLRAQALLEPEDSSSSDFVESPEATGA